MLIRWTELSYPDLGAYRDQAAVMINFASTEQHSLHLPVGTDAFLGAAVTERAAELCHRPVLLLPQVCFGYSPHHRFAPGYVTMPQHLLKEYAVSICENVIANGFSQMFLVNSHGGNQVYLSAAVNEIGEKHGTEFQLRELQYWDVAHERISAIRESELGGMGHAGEFETSMMMYLRPDLVQEEKIVPCGPVAERPWFQKDLLGSKAYQRFHRFDEDNREGHIGQPQLATAQKGKAFFESVTEELARFLDYFD
ncbi:Creatinine amidohydrolase [uncultured Clostridium sp.]|uniref:creatininase family protein n=1 Tax=Muriventricola aceti TaxID=2981773 RepID=UPI0008229CF4|nr:creatininase family protein [Muriventricola aceti]MCU6703913.1 creatininase family protein [Muriventricola aceti]SCH67086.1 Creatinine amidohydrolase [uncultured Clostridium sp.]SCJ63620.1 Creatinine amidohydrolase [uncultured Flavonifractor sp.]